MTTLTISLPDSLKEFIDREVETKGYGNVSEYVRGLLRDAISENARTVHKRRGGASQRGKGATAGAFDVVPYRSFHTQP